MIETGVSEKLVTVYKITHYYIPEGSSLRKPVICYVNTCFKETFVTVKLVCIGVWLAVRI
jgi:hypothetical protein